MLGSSDIALSLLVFILVVFLITYLFFYEKIRDFFIEWTHIPDNIVATLLAHAFAVFVFGVLYGLFVRIYR